MDIFWYQLERVLEICLHHLVWPYFMFGHIKETVFEVFDKLIILHVLQMALAGEPLGNCSNLKWADEEKHANQLKHTYNSRALTLTDSKTFSRFKSCSGNGEARPGGEPLCMALQSGRFNPPSLSLVVVFHPKESVVF